MSNEEQIAALRNEIRRAGRTAGILRGSLGLAAILCLLPLAFRLFSVDALRPVTTGWGLATVCGTFTSTAISPSVIVAGLSFLVGAPGAVLVGIVAAALYCELRIRRLARRLAPFTASERSAALLPLAADRSPDTRRIAASLCRTVNRRPEVAPVTHADGRGDEAASA